MDFETYVPGFSPSWSGYSLAANAPEATPTECGPSAIVGAVSTEYNLYQDDFMQNRWPTSTNREAHMSEQDVEPWNDFLHALPPSNSGTVRQNIGNNETKEATFVKPTEMTSTVSVNPHILDIKHLLTLFQRVVQPPAAMLIGGVRKWRRLQRHLVELSRQSREVLDILLCLVELLFIDEVSQSAGQDRETYARSICDRYNSALRPFRASVLDDKRPDQRCNKRDLAAIFLFAWFEVMRDQDEASTPFPRDLADTVILRDTTWNYSSRYLLSWLATLDSRATHLSGDRRLLSEQALLVVARHPFPVVSSHVEDHDDDTEHENLELASILRSTPSDSPQHAPDTPGW
ncbi:uncharacterized protein A1O9_03698 [Exophiala aquamarina CBS 119918]|uniref:Transcription factor domain-containing protein n=1 Tax=Exophiala aquamarina CBS 119918 TaxID=1182545 RepID=A0A072PTM5_9EURO|nr:uncharacterized protein A1O9_03698 [Exophiala aquamarina CBS 119918]KEF58855.1 hypothetical protein A1O9_03698 [Exophiala aquamarina CBS 119918]